MNIQVYTGKVFKCPAQAVVEASCVCKPGWGHRSFVNAAVAPSRSAAPEPSTITVKGYGFVRGKLGQDGVVEKCAMYHYPHVCTPRWCSPPPEGHPPTCPECGSEHRAWYRGACEHEWHGGMKVPAVAMIPDDFAPISPASQVTRCTFAYNTKCGCPKCAAERKAEVEQASAAPPSEREAAERIANKIVYSTANRELSPEQFKTFIAGIILHEFAAARAAVPQAAADGDDEATEARWQKRIYDLCREAVGPELAHTIDGSGCDSGDALDVTLLEIRQAIGLVRGAAAVPAPATEWENRYRQLLWESHAGYTHRSYLYGDDGEMQCNHHDCLLDFKRAAIEEIDKHLWEMNLKRAAKQQAVAGATAPPKEGK